MAQMQWLEDYVLQFVKSRTWADPIETFIADKCSIFDVQSIEENKLEYTIVHEEFKEMVESLLVAHLVDVDVSPEQFATAFESSIAAAKSDSALNAVVSQIVSVGDFIAFKEMMIARHRSQLGFALQHAAEVLQHAAEASPAHSTPAPEVPAVNDNTQILTAAPTIPRASRIASIIQSAGREKANNADKRELVRAGLAVSAGRLKAKTAMQRAGA
jgi:hypothetical protein